MPSVFPKYVLLTAARNEEALIENTLRSVVSQTVKPVRWVIASDGSTDRTDEIVKSYAVEHPWIELVRMPERKERQFAAKAHCINAGYALVKSLDFEIIGNLDADISFEPDFFSFLLVKFTLSPKLGVAGTPYSEEEFDPNRKSSVHSLTNLNHVSGQCQIFRRKCFEEIGGYVPIKGGAIDWVAVTTARMKGWETRTFPEKIFFHHRKMGTADRGPVAARYHYGKKAYYVGGHPLWELLRGCFEMRHRPWVIGGMAFQAGFLWAAITRMPRPVSKELIAFHRMEQMGRLRRLLKRTRPESSETQ